MTPAEAFVDQLRARGPAARVLELGTKRSMPDRSTHHREWSPEAQWTLADVEAGDDVDVVTDAHNLDELSVDRFDAYIACAVYEHLERPWRAALAAANALRPRGLLYVDTHQTFPLHGYPSDFWRFSREALALIFEDAGLEVIETSYAFPCTITPPAGVDWNPLAEAYLNVDVFARKPAP